jgi:hypothetical protein
VAVVEDLEVLQQPQRIGDAAGGIAGIDHAADAHGGVLVPLEEAPLRQAVADGVLLRAGEVARQVHVQVRALGGGAGADRPDQVGDPVAHVPAVAVIRPVLAGVLPVRPAQARAGVVGLEEVRSQHGHVVRQRPHHPRDHLPRLGQVHARRERLLAAAPGMVDPRASKLRVRLEERLGQEVQLVAPERRAQVELPQRLRLGQQQLAVAVDEPRRQERGDLLVREKLEGGGVVAGVLVPRAAVVRDVVEALGRQRADVHLHPPVRLEPNRLARQRPILGHVSRRKVEYKRVAVHSHGSPLSHRPAGPVTCTSE